MAIIADQISSYMEGSSLIRKMFEAGAILKQQYGEDAVCDFSLGNPDLPAPATVAAGMRKLADHALEPFTFGYMPNAGYPWARKKLAQFLCQEQGINLNENNLIITCGAAGGLNVLFKTILNPQDEVLSFSPYFVEYGFYVQNYQGVFKTVPSIADTFAPDLDALEKAITSKTKALLINSPNNPTGVIYTKSELEGIVKILEKMSEKYKQPIWLLSDEPYRFLSYDNVEVPSILPMYQYSAVISSFSKSLSLAGERLGYIIISPLLGESAQVINALTLVNRILGFVNPPVVGQHLMAAALGSQVDISIYSKRRDAMAKVLTAAGYSFQSPAGAFYFFPKAPGGDDVAFVERLQQEKILGVPGSAFGCKGHFRLAFCTDEKIILRAQDGLTKAYAHFSQK